jgi:poly(A) polymerase
MTTRLEPQEWMNAPATSAVLDALEQAGAEARFVGGCVRDSLIGRAVTDIDIATDAVPARVVEALEAAGIKAVPTGIDHGTVTAVSEGRPFEITTLRHDVETFGRHARVAFTDDWRADAARRDFTINAMTLARDGTLHDPFGGEQDLRAGRVRFVGDPRSRIEEDVLRLLRFFRFQAHYGTDGLDPDGLAACREMAPRLAALSAERVWSELRKLLAAENPGDVLRVMYREGILGVVLPEASALDRLDRLVALEAAQSRRWPRIVSFDSVRRLGALLTVDAAGAERAARRLKTSNAERERLVAIAASFDAPPDLRDVRAARRLRYRMPEDRFADAVLVLWAGGAGPAPWEEVLAVGACWTPPSFPIAGRDAAALGIPSGPRLGELLRAVEDWWIGQDFRPGRDECLSRLRAEAGVSGV